MFDLFRSREKSVRYLLGGLLGLVALSMVITLIPGIGGGTTTRDDQVVAEIGKDTITTREVQNQLQEALRGKQIPRELLETYLPQFVDQMIEERAVAYEASRLGFQITDADLAAAIQAGFPSVFPNGQFNKAAYEQTLSQIGLTVAQFEANLRKSMLQNALNNIALEGIFVPPSDVEQEYRRRNDKIKVAYIAMSPEKFRSQVKITPEELKAYFNTNRAAFMSPEKRGFQLLIADEGRIGETIDVSDGMLQQAYTANKERFRTPERVKVRHILLMTTNKPKEEVAKLKAKADDLLKQIKSGADFAELARQNSDDPGSKAKGGDLDWVVRGQTVKNFETAAFSLKPKELSNVITTEYGFHILQVMEKQDAHTQSFDEVKTQLATDYKRQAVFDKMQTVMDQARGVVAKNPAQAQQVAEQDHLLFVPVEKAGVGEPIPQVGNVPELTTAIVTLKKGEVSPVIQLPGNRLAVVVLTEIYPARPSEFAEAETQIRDRFQQDRSQTLAQQKIKEAADKLKAGDTDLDKLAKSLGVEVKTTGDFFNRDGAAEGIGQGAYLTDAFLKPVGSIVGPLSVMGQSFIVKIVAKQDTDMSKFAADRDALVIQLKSKKGIERRDLFYDSIMSRLIAEKKVKKHEDTIRRLAGAYRS